MGTFVCVLLLHDLGLLNMPCFIFREDSFFNLVFTVVLFPLLIHTIKTKELFGIVALLIGQVLFPIERPRLFDMFNIIAIVISIVFLMAVVPMWFLHLNAHIAPENQDFCTVFLLVDLFSLSDASTKLWINERMYTPVKGLLSRAVTYLVKSAVTFVREAMSVVFKLSLIVCFLVMANSQFT
jgi:hypothetical protein